MTATELAALDPDAARHIRRLAGQDIITRLADRGDTDPIATLALIQRAVATHLPRIAA
jgi:hypothetical protein